MIVTDNSAVTGTSRSDVVENNVVTLELDGSGAGAKAKATITFVVATKVSAAPDNRYEAGYKAAGITPTEITVDDNNHIVAKVTVDSAKLVKFLADNTNADGSFNSVLAPLTNGSPSTLWWGLSVTAPVAANNADRYFDGSTTASTVSGDAYTQKLHDNCYQDWVSIATFDTATKSWTVNQSRVSTTRIVFKTDSTVISTADWVFDVTVQ